MFVNIHRFPDFSSIKRIETLDFLLMELMVVIFINWYQREKMLYFENNRKKGEQSID